MPDAIQTTVMDLTQVLPSAKLASPDTAEACLDQAFDAILSEASLSANADLPSQGEPAAQEQSFLGGAIAPVTAETDAQVLPEAPSPNAVDVAAMLGLAPLQPSISLPGLAPVKSMETETPESQTAAPGPDADEDTVLAETAAIAAIVPQVARLAQNSLTADMAEPPSVEATAAQTDLQAAPAQPLADVVSAGAPPIAEQPANAVQAAQDSIAPESEVSRFEAEMNQIETADQAQARAQSEPAQAGHAQQTPVSPHPNNGKSSVVADGAPQRPPADDATPFQNTTTAQASHWTSASEVPASGAENLAVKPQPETQANPRIEPHDGPSASGTTSQPAPADQTNPVMASRGMDAEKPAMVDAADSRPAESRLAANPAVTQTEDCQTNPSAPSRATAAATGTTTAPAPAVPSAGPLSDRPHLPQTQPLATAAEAPSPDTPDAGVKPSSPARPEAGIYTVETQPAVKQWVETEAGTTGDAAPPAPAGANKPSEPIADQSPRQVPTSAEAGWNETHRT
ncbi:MAG TPA: hypothetical protein P5137_17080, partial [Candidatus Brocadiia bacterium]|nr:hypothetical protein [Candidatus Brocadiia bacterium]